MESTIQLLDSIFSSSKGQKEECFVSCFPLLFFLLFLEPVQKKQLVSTVNSKPSTTQENERFIVTEERDKHI
jgi:hypothetical protein